MPKKDLFFAEMTDTFGGEANYCWVRRVKIAASSFRGAVIKMSRHFGLQGRLKLNWDCGDERRYDVQGAAACVFVSEYDEYTAYLEMEEI